MLGDRSKWTASPPVLFVICHAVSIQANATGLRDSAHHGNLLLALVVDFDTGTTVI